MEESSLKFLKRGVWLYFILLIFEGALRKWVLPGLAEPLLVIRDPLAIWLIFRSLQSNIWRPNAYVVSMWGLAIFSFILTLLVGHGNIIVAVYGLRITAFHFPLIFVIGAIFQKEDVLKMGKAMLWLNIGMTLLVAIQFYSPQSSFINIGVGGDTEGSGFSGAAGFYRVPGTFSFTNGLSLFYGMSAAFIFYFWVTTKQKVVSKALLIISTMALLAAIPLSISRTVLFEIILSFLFMMAIIVKIPSLMKKTISGVIAGIILLLVLNTLPFFQTATEAFTERFTVASEIEGGVVEGTLVDRFLGGMLEPITSGKSPFWGYGMGMGTNAGAQLMTGDKEFLIAEQEFGRLIGERGIFLGLLAILVRVILVAKLLLMAWKAINFDNLLPWLLISFGFLQIMQGQWAQPTALGFGALIGGLIVAAFNTEPDKNIRN